MREPNAALFVTLDGYSEGAPARSAPAHVRLPHGLLISIEAIAKLPSE